MHKINDSTSRESLCSLSLILVYNELERLKPFVPCRSISEKCNFKTLFLFENIINMSVSLFANHLPSLPID